MIDKKTEKAIKEGRVICVIDSCGIESWRIYDTSRNAKDGAQRAEERGYDVTFITTDAVVKQENNRKAA